MINQPNLNGKALADAIVFHLKSLNLPLEKMIGQAMTERVLCPEKERRSSGSKKVLPKSFICTLFSTCIEFSFSKILCNT